jgi:hypothetical protein
VSAFAAFEASGPRGLVMEDASDAAGGVRGRATPAHAVFAALAVRHRARLVLHGLDAYHGAAFSLDDDAPELWLVDLSGRPRALPGALGEGVQSLAEGRGDARWSWRKGRRLAAYGIGRVRVAAGEGARVHRIAAAWCAGRLLEEPK